MIAATGFFVICDSFMKAAMAVLPPFEVLFLRGVAATVLCGVLVVAASRGPEPLAAAGHFVVGLVGGGAEITAELGGFGSERAALLVELTGDGSGRVLRAVGRGWPDGLDGLRAVSIVVVVAHHHHIDLAVHRAQVALDALPVHLPAGAGPLQLSEQNLGQPLERCKQRA